MSLLQTLLKPDREENPERALIGHAANLLQVGEFQFLQLAYADWHGQDMPSSMTDKIFAEYMLRGVIPIYARAYARKIVGQEKAGSLDMWNPKFHRFDAEYHTTVPNGMRNFVVSVIMIAAVIFGGILVSHFSIDCGMDSSSILPPYFQERNLPDGRAGDPPTE